MNETIEVVHSSTPARVIELKFVVALIELKLVVAVIELTFVVAVIDLTFVVAPQCEISASALDLRCTQRSGRRSRECVPRR